MLNIQWNVTKLWLISLLLCLTFICSYVMYFRICYRNGGFLISVRWLPLILQKTCWGYLIYQPSLWDTYLESVSTISCNYAYRYVSFKVLLLHTEIHLCLKFEWLVIIFSVIWSVWLSVFLPLYILICLLLIKLDL